MTSAVLMVSVVTGTDASAISGKGRLGSKPVTGTSSTILAIQYSVETTSKKTAEPTSPARLLLALADLGTRILGLVRSVH